MKLLSFLIGFSLLFLSSCSKIANEAKSIQLNERGLVLLNQDEAEKAAVLFKKAATLSNSKATQTTCWRNAALCFVRSAESDSARFYFNKASKAAVPFSYENLVNRAEVYIIDGDLDKAIKKLNLAIKMKPYQLEAYNSLGLIYYGDHDINYRDLEKAYTLNKKAFEIQPEPTTKDVYARTLYMVDSLELAEKHFSALKKQYPNFLDYDYYLGMISYEQGEVEEGRKILNEVIAQDSGYYYGIEYVFESN